MSDADIQITNQKKSSLVGKSNSIHFKEKKVYNSDTINIYEFVESFNVTL